MTILYIGIFGGVALLAICALLLANILENAREINECCIRIAYAHTQTHRNQVELIEGLISLSSRLDEVVDTLNAERAEKGAYTDPDSPDEMSEADRLAERRFSDGVLNILGYSGMPDEEVKT